MRITRVVKRKTGVNTHRKKYNATGPRIEFVMEVAKTQVLNGCKQTGDEGSKRQHGRESKNVEKSTEYRDISRFDKTEKNKISGRVNSRRMCTCLTWAKTRTCNKVVEKKKLGSRKKGQ